MIGPAVRISLLALCALITAPLMAVAESQSVEYAVKAAYLYKFADFIQWPTTVFDSPASDVNLCIVGNDPFGAALDTVIAKQHIGERAITLHHLTGVGQDSRCHILFIGGSDPKAIARILNAVRGSGVLTVTDADSTADSPSIIRFVTQDNHVRFAIDAQAAAQNGITVSSKLLSLALTVMPKK